MAIVCHGRAGIGTLAGAIGGGVKGARTDPETGETKAEPVLRLLRHSGQPRWCCGSGGRVGDGLGGQPFDLTNTFGSYGPGGMTKTFIKPTSPT